MTTIRDVAQQAGVSPATASRVISNKGYVSTSARSRVIAAVRDLGYVPNGMARGLKTHRSRLVALLVPEIVNSFYTTIARGVEDVANKSGLQVILGNTDEDVAKEKAYVELLVANHVDGVIVAPAGRTARRLRPLLERKVPTVVIDRLIEGFSGDVVRGDNVQGAEALTNHLLTLGHRSIALINGDLETSVARQREAGYRRALQEAGLEPDEELVSAGTWFIEDAKRRTEDMLAAGCQFSAIFAANNFMAIGALRALREHSISVPEDIAIVCFDDIEVAADIYPFLTVMAQPAYTMGTLAMQLLLERIEGSYQGPARDLVLSPRLLIRQSCGTRLTSPENVDSVCDAPPIEDGPSAGSTRRLSGREVQPSPTRT